MAIAAGIGDDSEEYSVLSREQRQTVLGALDTLGTLLADDNHPWTEGERAIYEEATRLLGAQAEPPGGTP